jgi:hypothetical protein
MYKWYTKYMKYTLSEFRANTREAFNKAENGGVVLIERHGIVFELRVIGMNTQDEKGKATGFRAKVPGGFAEIDPKYLGTDLHPSTVAEIKSEPVRTEPEETGNG